MGGNVVEALEEAGVHLAGVLGELDHVGEAFQRSTRLVEADVAVAANAEQLHVDATRFGNGLVVAGQRIGGGVDAAGDVHALRVEIDVVEQVVVHEVAVALIMRGLETDILVEVERGHVLEADLASLVQFDELGIEVERRGAGSKTQHGVRLRVQHFLVDGSSLLRNAFGGIDDDLHDAPSVVMSRNATRCPGAYALMLRGKQRI